jgi:putative cell wall-binding protein
VRQATTPLPAVTAKTRRALCLLLAATLVLSGLFLSAQARAGEADGRSSVEVSASSSSSNGDLLDAGEGGGLAIAKFDVQGQLDGTVTQHEGEDRHDTAVRASVKAYPDPSQVDSVILAYSYDFPDALAASYLAGVLDAPILLCDTYEIPAATTSELERLRPNAVYIAGGSGVISEDVKDILDAYDFTSSVTRLGGVGREETAYQIAIEAKNKGGIPATVFVANAADFPDALSAGSLSAGQGVPILLTATGSLDEWARRFLEENGISDAIIVGGSGSVSATVATQLRALPHNPTVTRWSGDDRYATSKDVLEKAIAKWNLTPTVIGLASGDGFPDALVGGAAVGNRGGLLAITGPDALSAAAEGLISTYKGIIFGVEIFGGTGTVRVVGEVQLLLSKAATPDKVRNPHKSHLGNMDCTTCHKEQGQSVMMCTQCHSDVVVPDGWLTYKEAQERQKQ